MKDNTVFLMAASIYAGYVAKREETSIQKDQDLMLQAAADAMRLVGLIEDRYTPDGLKVVEKWKNF